MGFYNADMDDRTVIERKSDRELVVTRIFNAPARIVYEAWTKPELFIRWWAPESSGVPMLSCDMDIRVGGSCRVEFGTDPAKSMAFFGRYLEVIENERLVWTNEESEDAAVTTVTLENKGDVTLLTLSEFYPSKEALDASYEGMEGGAPEQFAQLDGLLVVDFREELTRDFH